MFDKAKEHLRRFGLEERAMRFEVSSQTVELAALAVGCPSAQIAKTLSFLVKEKPVLVVAAGDARVDNGKFKAFFHCKAAMLPPQEVRRLVGYPVGGVCPFGVNEGVAVYLDSSLLRFDTVYPACGTGDSAVRLSPEELMRASGASAWISVCRVPEGPTG